MKQEGENKDRLVAFRVTQMEYEQLERLRNATICRKLSEYIRNVVLHDPVYVKTRNLSIDDFLNEIVRLRNEFKAVGNNFNQFVHKLHTLQDTPEVRFWIKINEPIKDELFRKIRELQDRMNQAYDLWLDETNRPKSKRVG